MSLPECVLRSTGKLPEAVVGQTFPPTARHSRDSHFCLGCFESVGHILFVVNELLRAGDYEGRFRPVVAYTLAIQEVRRQTDQRV